MDAMVMGRYLGWIRVARSLVRLLSGLLFKLF